MLIQHIMLERWRSAISPKCVPSTDGQRVNLGVHSPPVRPFHLLVAPDPTHVTCYTRHMLVM